MTFYKWCNLKKISTYFREVLIYQIAIDYDVEFDEIDDLSDDKYLDSWKRVLTRAIETL